MDWKARIETVQEVGQGDMQVGATLADMDVPESDRVTYPWVNTYGRDWLIGQSNQQVQQAVIADLTNYAQDLADSSSRIDYFKQFIGQVIDLNVVVP